MIMCNNDKMYGMHIEELNAHIVYTHTHMCDVSLVEYRKGHTNIGCWPFEIQWHIIIIIYELNRSEKKVKRECVMQQANGQKKVWKMIKLSIQRIRAMDVR